MDSINPLAAQDIALANSIIQTADMLIRFYEQCRNCGLDVASLTAQAKANRDFAARVIEEFGGGQSAG